LGSQRPNLVQSSLCSERKILYKIDPRMKLEPMSQRQNRVAGDAKTFKMVTISIIDCIVTLVPLAPLAKPTKYTRPTTAAEQLLRNQLAKFRVYFVGFISL
jgi:hypothetical protein